MRHLEYGIEWREGPGSAGELPLGTSICGKDNVYLTACSFLWWAVENVIPKMREIVYPVKGDE